MISESSYTSFVQTMKRGLLVFCAGLVLTLTVWPSVIQKKNEKAFSVIMQRIEGLPDHMELLSPVYSGIDTKGRHLEVHATKGLPDQPQPKVVNLEGIQAKISDEKEWTTLIADKGSYRIEDQMIDLEGRVRIKQSSGYTAVSEKMFFDLKQGILRSPNGIEGQGTLGNVTGKTLEIRQKDNTLHLGGGVHMVITPEKIP
jgi:lipopolysaccharide export system protein LptC